MITIVTMIQTCDACPSQWDGWDTEGNYFYFRYRGGVLRVHGPMDDESGMDYDPDPVPPLISIEPGAPASSGDMTFAELRELCVGVLEFDLRPLRTGELRNPSRTRNENAAACVRELLASCRVVQNENGKPTALMHRDYVRSMLERVRNALDGSEPW